MRLSDERLSLLLVHWFHLREQGKIVSAAALCSDCPELAEQLAIQIQGIQSLEAQYSLAGRGVSTSCPTRVSPTEEHRANGSPPVIPGYEILGQLGRGGMGIVSRARHLALKRVVALKQILAGPHAQPEQLTRFRSEAEAVARLQHPAIVQIYEVAEHDGLPYFALECVEGGTLAQKLQEAPLSPKVAARMVETLARAIHYAHERGVVHRDLKPANILLTADGAPKITDFGLAKRLDVEVGQTQSGMVLGTPSYMAPEQVRGKPAEVGPLTDVYALGATLYDCLTGRPPVRGASLAETLQQVLTQEPVPPRQLQPRVPRDLDTICLKCLDKEPRRRYPSAAALAEDLRCFLAGEPIQARATPAWERAWKWARRRPTAAVVICLLALFVVSLLLGGVWSNVQVSKALGQQGRELRGEQKQLAAHQEMLLEEQKQLAGKAGRLVEREREDRDTILQREGLLAATRLMRAGRYAEARDALGSIPSSRRGWEWRRMLWECNRVPRPTEVLTAHDWAVAALLGTTDGRTVVSSGHDGQLICWHTAGGAPKMLEPGTESEPWRLWSHALFACNNDVATAPDCFPALCWVKENELLAGVSCRENKAVLWDLRAGTRQVLLRHAHPLCAVAASPDGQHLVVGDEQGELLHREGTRGDWQPLRLTGGAILRAVFVPPRFWAVGQADGTLSLIDLKATRQLTHQTLPGPVWNLDVAPAEGLLAVACEHGTVRVFTVDPGRATLFPAESYTVPAADDAARGAVHTVRFSPDAKQLAAGDGEGRLLLWNRGDSMPRFVARDQGNSMLIPDRLRRLPLPFQRRMAGLAFAPDGRDLFTAGWDSTVKRWSIAQPSRTSEFRVGTNPQVCLDPDDPRLLWVGSEDGMLALVDSDTGRACSRHKAHKGAVRGLAQSAEARLVATAGDDGVVRLWRREGSALRPVGQPIQHDSALVSVALSPDGKRVAAYDAEDCLHLWHIGGPGPAPHRSVPAEGEGAARLAALGASLVGLVGSVERRGPFLGVSALISGRISPAHPLLVAFNRDGTVLAAAGPGQTFWLLSGETLKIQQRLDGMAVSGAGGTAVAWHPRDTLQLVCGDSASRISFHPPLGPGARAGARGHGSTVVSLVFSPEGERLAAAFKDGTVTISDYRRLGLVLARFTGRADLTRLLFDPAGSRLLLVHRDGQIAVWETDMQPRPIPNERARSWGFRTLEQETGVEDVSFDLPAVTIDREGRVAVLYSASKGAANLGLGGPFRSGDQRIVLARETAEGFESEELPAHLSMPNAKGGEAPLVPRGSGVPPNSLALLAHRDGLFAAIRWPMPDKGGVAGQLVLLRRANSAKSRWETELVEQPDNWGFQSQLISRAGGKPTILHFPHDPRHVLLATQWNGGAWVSAPCGHYGDGYGHQTVVDPHGHLHIGFNPCRFGGDPSPVTYLRINGPGQQPCVRESITSDYGSLFQGITVTPQAEPVITYTRPGSMGNLDLVVAHRTPDGWERRVIFANAVPGRTSNPTCDDRGRLRFALVPEGGRRILLVTGCDQRWRTEIVWEAAETGDSAARDLVTLLDAQQRPVIVATGKSETQRWWLRVFRPADGR